MCFCVETLKNLAYFFVGRYFWANDTYMFCGAPGSFSFNIMIGRPINEAFAPSGCSK